MALTLLSSPPLLLLLSINHRATLWETDLRRSFGPGFSRLLSFHTCLEADTSYFSKLQKYFLDNISGSLNSNADTLEPSLVGLILQIHAAGDHGESFTPP